jgi:hypothetical protein
MASRWAFEAAMVTQFKDNGFEKEFYVYDKVMADADFKKIYFIPELESKLDFVNLQLRNPEPAIHEEVVRILKLIRNEIGRELDEVGHDKFKPLDQLTPERFDSLTYRSAADFMQTLKRYYVNRYNKADQEKDRKVNRLTRTAEKEKEFAAFRESYENEAISSLVKNVEESHRIIEKGGKFVQKIYPIYKDPDPDHRVDFDAQFYMPRKHFLNQNIDTFYFNLAVIWSMSVVLGIALYYEILRKIIDGLGNISNPLPKRM